MQRPTPPRHLQWLVDLVGAEATLSLLERLAGTRVYVPMKPKTFGVLDDKQARRLSKEHGGEHIELPLAKAWRVEMYRVRGFTQNAIALKLGMSHVSVGRYLTRASMTEPSPPRRLDPVVSGRRRRRVKRASPGGQLILF